MYYRNINNENNLFKDSCSENPQSCALRKTKEAQIEEMKEHLEEIVNVKIVNTFRGKRWRIIFNDGEISLLSKELTTSTKYRQKYFDNFDTLPPYLFGKTWRQFLAILREKAYGVRGV